MAAADTRALEKTVAELKKKIQTLEARLKSDEQKIKFLVDNTLNAKQLDKYTAVLAQDLKADIGKTEKEMAQRMGEIAGQLINKREAEAKKETEGLVEKMIQQMFREHVDKRLTGIEAEIAKLAKR